MANPTYAEVIPRELTGAQQSELESLVSPAWYVCRVGRLNVRGLLTAFQGYYREHPESWVDRYGHREAGPQLVLHAYLHPVVKSRGRITREYAVARGRTDLLIEWPTSRANAGVPCEQACHRVQGCRGAVRPRDHRPPGLAADGGVHGAEYMDLCGAGSGHLVVFDMRSGKTWEDRIFTRDRKPGQPPITVWGM